MRQNGLAFSAIPSRFIMEGSTVRPLDFPPDHEDSPPPAPCPVEVLDETGPEPVGPPALAEPPKVPDAEHEQEKEPANISPPSPGEEDDCSSPGEGGPPPSAAAAPQEQSSGPPPSAAAAPQEQSSTGPPPTRLGFVDTHCHVEIAACTAGQANHLGEVSHWDDLTQERRLAFRRSGWTREKWMRLLAMSYGETEFFYEAYRCAKSPTAERNSDGSRDLL